MRETYFTWGYSPIRDESGQVGGVFSSVLEQTERERESVRARDVRDARRASFTTLEPDLERARTRHMEGGMSRVTAVFDDSTQAERAVSALRGISVPDARLSVVARRQDDVEVAGGKHADSAGERVGKGALAGAGVGAIFGLAAALIPGVGPFITAGVLASTLGVTGGAAAAGAIVGGTSGAIAGALTRGGYSREEADFYGPAVERGGVLLAVDADDASESAVRSVLSQNGGRTHGRQATVDRDVTRDEEFRAP